MAGNKARVQPPLEGSPLGVLHGVREHASRALVDYLDKVRGRDKTLIIDPALSGPLALVVQVALLKSHGVNHLYHLEDAEFDEGEEDSVVYLVQADVDNMKAIANQVRDLERGGGGGREIHLLMVPRRTLVCEKILEHEGVLGSLILGDYRLEMVPFEEDVISIEAEGVFANPEATQNNDAYFQLATVLAQLQRHNRRVPTIHGKGLGALSVTEIMFKLLEDEGDGADEELDLIYSGAGVAIEDIILLDREVDSITPFCTQLTYEGLIDEVYGIHNGIVELKAQEADQKPRRVPMNSSDNLFRELRDLNFAVVGKQLQEKAQTVKEGYNDLDQSSMTKMKEFVKKLNRLPEMQKHTEIAEHLTEVTTQRAFLTRLRHEQDLIDQHGVDAACEFAEEAMFLFGEDVASVLSLLCLASVASGGLPKRQYDGMHKAILQCYGYEYMLIFEKLQAAGFLRKNEGLRNPFPAVRKALQLVKEELNDDAPDDIAYAYSGYAPVSCRLVERALQPQGWAASASTTEALKYLPGPTVALDKEEVQRRLAAAAGEPLDGAGGGPNAGPRSLAIVVFIGGVTFAEVNALRFLRGQLGRDIVVLTTKIVNGRTLLKPLLATVPRVLVGTS